MAGGSGRRGKSESADNEDSTMLKEILEQLKIINTKISGIEERVVNIENSLQFHSDVVDELKSDVTHIKTVLPAVQEKVFEQEKLTLNRSIDIQGIPHHPDEDLNSIVAKLAKQRNIDINCNNIDCAYRNRTKKSIIVRFIQTHARDKLIQAFRGNDKQRMNSKELGFKFDNQIYVNELLSFETRQLFYKTRKYKTEKGFKYAWTINQKVYIRVTQDSQAVLIKSEEDLYATV